MTDDVLERLRRANPVPGDPGAPPVELVLGQLGAQPRAGRPHRRWRGVVVPALGVLSTVVVVALALVLAGHRAPRPSTGSARTAAGLPGVVVAGGSFAADGRGVVSINHCHPCGGPAVGDPQVEHNWTLSTSNGGGSWHTVRTGWGLGTAEFNVPTAHFSGAADARGVGSYRVGEGPIRFDPYVTHDGGVHWSRARAPFAGVLGDPSVAGSTVWATVGGRCLGHNCFGVEVLRGSTSGSRLNAVGLAPWSASSGLSVTAGSPSTAYVQVFAGHQAVRTLVTRDSGHTWQTLRAVCRTTAPDVILRAPAASSVPAAAPSSVWELCPAAGPTTVLERSDDRGRHWHRYRIPAHGGIANLIPVSGTQAWTAGDSGYVSFTADGGASWQTVWSAGAYHPRAHLPSLSAVTRARAAITATQTAGGRTRVVVYRTHDGGGTWQASYVPLP
jgi:hypothetical protein